MPDGHCGGCLLLMMSLGGGSRLPARSPCCMCVCSNLCHKCLMFAQLAGDFWALLISLLPTSSGSPVATFSSLLLSSGAGVLIPSPKALLHPHYCINTPFRLLLGDKIFLYLSCFVLFFVFFVFLTLLR